MNARSPLAFPPTLRLRPISLTAGLLLGLSVTSAPATTIHVPAEAATLQAGIDLAAPGDTVLVAPGSYSGPGNEDVDFGGKDLVLRSEEGPEVTIVQGPAGDPYVDPPARGFQFVSGETAAAVVDGFTIRDFAILDTPIGSGGAAMIIAAGSAPTVRNCAFLQNRSVDGEGGAVRARGGTFEDCEFRGNVSEGWNASGRGGALYLEDGTLRRCVVRDNHAYETQFGPGVGGGVATYGLVSVEDCLIVENSATEAGGISLVVGGLGSPLQIWISGCTIASNESLSGASQLSYSAQTDVTGQRLYISTSIVWSEGDCGPSDVATFEEFANVARLTFVCSVIDRSSISGTMQVVYDPHSVEDDPLFCDPRICGSGSDGDYALQPESPCLPASSSCGALIGAVEEVCGAAGVPSASADLPVLLLGPSQPNPATNVARVLLELSRPQEIRAVVFDAGGRLVKVLAWAALPAGAHELSWELTDAGGDRVPAGVYSLRVRSAIGSEVTRLVVLN